MGFAFGVCAFSRLVMTCDGLVRPYRPGNLSGFLFFLLLFNVYEWVRVDGIETGRPGAEDSLLNSMNVFIHTLDVPPLFYCCHISDA